MLDLARLQRLKLTRYPLSQRFFGRLLGINYGWLPGVELIVENPERVPDTPVIFAMNHTDRYNYFPFQYEMWQRFNRFTATWVKGKYYENRLLAWFMESMLQLPTVSRGYLITRDFLATMGRTPTDSEYARLRAVVDARAIGEPAEALTSPEIPEKLLRTRRRPFGLEFDPEQLDYADHICDLFRAMMGRFVELNEEAIEIGLDLLIFPQGTRSRRLLPGHIGIGQIALHLGIPIVPVGCNGCDEVYPGASPFAGRGRIVYRIGEPIHYEDLRAHHIRESFAPFSAEAERDHVRSFQAVADEVTDAIEPLLDPVYQRAPDQESDSARSAGRFL